MISGYKLYEFQDFPEGGGGNGPGEKVFLMLAQGTIIDIHPQLEQKHVEFIPGPSQEFFRQL